MKRNHGSLFMGTTEKPAHQSISEIIRILAASGACSISNDYTNGQISGMTFSMQLPGGLYSYALPARSANIYAKIRATRKRDRGSVVESEKRDREQAERVAWRQLLRWIEAQMAIVDTGLSTMDEVFLPYVHAENGQTMFQLFKANEQKRLASGKK